MKSYKAIKMGNLGYLINKIIVNFIVTFIVISSALLIIFFIGFFLHKGIAGTMLGIDKLGWMKENYTFIYIIVQISYVAFLGISFSQLGLAIAALTKNKIITMIGPFVLYILIILTVPYWLNTQIIGDFARSSEIGILFRSILALGIFKYLFLVTTQGANYISTNGYNMIFSYLHLVLFFIIVLVGLRVIFKKNFYELFISGGF